MEMTDLSSRDATNLLVATNWNINQAIDLHLNSTISRENSPVVKDLETVFLNYKEDDETIGIDGTLNYIEDLGYQPEDLSILALAEFLDSPTTGVFKKKDFINSWARENVGTIDEMRHKLKEFDNLLQSDDSFLQRIYNFTFKYVLDQGQRSLNPDVSVEYWQLLLAKFDSNKVARWCTFITQKHNYAISKDQWQMTFEFFLWWRDHDLKEYDEALAWPSLMDTFVENELE